MKRGSKCIGRTINPSEPESCVRPAAVRKLVAVRIEQPCPDSRPGSSSYATPRPIPVRICTPSDMRRTCRPKLCDCPQKPAPRSAAGKLGAALFFLAKAAVAAGLVYWTNAEGIWGSSAETEDLYRRILATVFPGATSEPDNDHTRQSCWRRFRSSAIERYNRAVVGIATVIVEASTSARRRIRDLLFPCEDRNEVAKNPADAIERGAETEDEN